MSEHRQPEQGQDTTPERDEERSLPTQKGAIDSLEREWALIALDDGQRLDWPRDRLPLDAKEGTVAELSLHQPGACGALPEEGTWEGTVEVKAEALPAEAAVRLGTQRLRWPGAEQLAPGERVVVRMQVDPDATDQRRRQVEDLINDLFG